MNMFHDIRLNALKHIHTIYSKINQFGSNLISSYTHPPMVNASMITFVKLSLLNPSKTQSKVIKIGFVTL
jgi:uncharacterized membrane protein